MGEGQPNVYAEKYLGMFAWFMWGVALIVISAMVWPAPLRHSDCWNYFQPASDWWVGKNLYRYNINIDGFLYLPQFAIFYTPFMKLGHPVGDVIWRTFGLGLMAMGVWRMARILAPGRVWFIFALSTLGVLPSCIASLRNGEANLHIAGLMLLAAGELCRRRWGWAALWLVGGLVVKPIMIVMLLLTGAVYRPMISRLVVGLAVIAVLPFAFQTPSYVWAQYHDFAHWMSVASQPPGLFCNVRGFLGKMGWTMPQPVFQMIATLAALVTLGLCLVAGRRWQEPWRAIFIFGFSACYLMLCNPRTEASSYVMLAPVVAFPGAYLFAIRNRWASAIALLFIALLLICDCWAYKRTENWLKPLTCILVTGLLIRELFRERSEETASESRENADARQQAVEAVSNVVRAFPHVDGTASN